jgi:hypothetical protein
MSVQQTILSSLDQIVQLSGVRTLPDETQAESRRVQGTEVLLFTNNSMAADEGVYFKGTNSSLKPLFQIDAAHLAYQNEGRLDDPCLSCRGGHEGVRKVQTAGPEVI